MTCHPTKTLQPALHGDSTSVYWMTRPSTLLIIYFVGIETIRARILRKLLCEHNQAVKRARGLSPWISLLSIPVIKSHHEIDGLGWCQGETADGMGYVGFRVVHECDQSRCRFQVSKLDVYMVVNCNSSTCQHACTAIHQQPPLSLYVYLLIMCTFQANGFPPDHPLTSTRIILSLLHCSLVEVVHPATSPFLACCTPFRPLVHQHLYTAIYRNSECEFWAWFLPTTLYWLLV